MRRCPSPSSGRIFLKDQGYGFKIFPMPTQHHTNLPAFVAECTLGKLAKWLRLAGFDTLYDIKSPDFRRLARYASTQNRQVLSRTQRVISRLEAAQGLLIQFDAPIDQLRQVMRHFDIQRCDLRPLSRCSQCNYRLRAADQENLRAAVPDYTRQQHDKFLMCPECRRVYWPGTHGAKMLAFIEAWFAVS